MRAEDQAISVVMPVRNAMPFLDAAIGSILNQTHRNFELLIGDDGSTDGSSECIAAWAARDARIRVIRNNGAGLGPSGSSNWVARSATHDWIARMDADDISRADRLHRQMTAMLAHPDAVVIGSLFEVIDHNNRRVFGLNRRALHNMQNSYPVAHGSILFRRDAFERAGGYREACDYWEDNDLFYRLMRQGTAILLPEAIFQYRFSPTSSRLAANEIQMTRAADLCVRCLDAYAARGDYEDILEAEARQGPPAALMPMVVARVVYERLWRGDVRTIRASWAHRNTRMPWNARGIAIRLFASWAMRSPASLRLALRLRAGYRDWRARNIAGPDDILVRADEATGWRVVPLARDAGAAAVQGEGGQQAHPAAARVAMAHSA